MTELWTQPSWRAQAEAWIDEELEQLGLQVTGPTQQPHVRPWSTVLRIPTREGDLYFKASAPVQAFEVPLLQALMDDFADRLPSVLAFDVERAWMLMRDGGTQLRELVNDRRDLHHWLAVVPLYAELQIGVAARADELVGLGVPDLRLGRLPEQLAALLERGDVVPEVRDAIRVRVPRILELCEELSSDRIPATLQHNDLHTHNVLVRDGRYRIFDWGDACVTHPFLSLRTALGSVERSFALADESPDSGRSGQIGRRSSGVT